MKHLYHVNARVFAVLAFVFAFVYKYFIRAGVSQDGLSFDWFFWGIMATLGILVYVNYLLYWKARKKEEK